MPWVPGGMARRGPVCRCCGRLSRVLVVVASGGPRVAVCPECDGVERTSGPVVFEPLRSAVPREAGR
jgi:hypothetical protein